MTGFDDLIWGGNSKDYHVGYHGRGNRARFYINWVTGEGKLWTDEEEVVEEEVEEVSHDGEEHSHDHDTESDSAANRVSLYFAVFAVISTLIF